MLVHSKAVILANNPGERPLASAMRMKAGPPLARTGGERTDNYRISAKRVEYMDMEQQAVRKTYKYKLKPTPDQEWALDRTLMLCRHIYNAAVEERREAWRKCGVAVTYYQQKAELPGIKTEMPEYSEVHSQVLQDVVLRVDRAFQAFFRRVQSGETPGYPRFHGHDRYNSITYPQFGNGGLAR
jgi:Helix-turn-helix domain